jgi:hypothetical protein
VVVADFDIVGLTIAPSKTYPPLIVDPYRILAKPITREGLEAIAGRDAQII